MIFLQSNRENCEHQKYLWNVIVLQEKSQLGVSKLSCNQELSLVCGFVASVDFLIFAVIGYIVEPRLMATFLGHPAKRPYIFRDPYLQSSCHPRRH